MVGNVTKGGRATETRLWNHLSSFNFANCLDRQQIRRPMKRMPAKLTSRQAAYGAGKKTKQKQMATCGVGARRAQQHAMAIWGLKADWVGVWKHGRRQVWSGPASRDARGRSGNSFVSYIRGKVGRYVRTEEVASIFPCSLRRRSSWLGVWSKQEVVRSFAWPSFLGGSLGILAEPRFWNLDALSSGFLPWPASGVSNGYTSPLQQLFSSPWKQVADCPPKVVLCWIHGKVRYYLPGKRGELFARIKVLPCFYDNRGRTITLASLQGENTAAAAAAISHDPGRVIRQVR
ncbi:hypothetical protein B0T24DRAFT_614412 [Lasiosphaeria ovina]|uniref:Uncharacterized protein n=1 Tax=Lasiosphaeria ovina TaxID=92902 RepID=A0AAE0TUG3_9PEZI|nr:hypothetical protein B0T24DRAFT_614412 [Lasiosphaeria ovina]